MTQARAREVNKPIGSRLDSAQVGGATVHFAVDGTTQVLQREYQKGIHDGILAAWGFPDHQVAFLQENARELRTKIMLAELSGPKEGDS